MRTAHTAAPRPAPRTAPAGLVLALLATLTACGDPEASDAEPAGATGASSSVEEDLAALPAVREVSVVQDVVEEDGPEVTEIVLDLEPDPDRADVVEVLGALVDTDAGRSAAYVDVPGASWSSGPMGGRSGVRNVDDETDVEDAADVLGAGLAVVADLGGRAAIDLDYDPYSDSVERFVVVVPASDSPADVDAAVAAVAADPVLREAEAQVVGQDG